MSRSDCDTNPKPAGVGMSAREESPDRAVRNLKEFYDSVNGDFEGVVNRLSTPENVRRMLELFLSEDFIAALKAAVDANDAAAAFDAVHALKGVSGNLGLDELYRASSELADQLRSKTSAPDRSLYQAVLDASQNIVDEWDGYLKGEQLR